MRWPSWLTGRRQREIVYRITPGTSIFIPRLGSPEGCHVLMPDGSTFEMRFGFNLLLPGTITCEMREI